MVRIKELSEEERPREKLLKKGAHALTIYELLAIILRTGTKDLNAIELSKELINEFASLKNLFSADKEELLKIKGLNTGKVATLLSVIELAKRYQKEHNEKRIIINSSQDVYNYYGNEYMGVGNREVFLVLYLNSKNEVLREEKLGSSMANACLIHPQEFIRGLIKYGASRVILIHNHPSNDIKPSEQDIRFTKELFNSLKYFGFDLLDHIIFGLDNYFSMKDRNIF
ncbi:MAG: DNA repair protein RadC [Proteobacteria bacterium]|nr:DNA repair protein RadC [Pseudomonadota bacterium]